MSSLAKVCKQRRAGALAERRAPRLNGRLGLAVLLQTQTTGGGSGKAR